MLLEGGASGADALASRWALSVGVGTTTFKADWQRYGPSAGPRRNRKMLVEGKAQLVVAFAGGAGTASCVKQALELKVPVIDLRVLG